MSDQSPLPTTTKPKPLRNIAWIVAGPIIGIVAGLLVAFGAESAL